MNIFLVRHGQTNENIKKVYYGSVDAELNFKGTIQATAAGEKLKKMHFDRIYTSDRKRTIQTAYIILKSNDNFINMKDINSYNIIKNSRLNEINFGDFEGKTYGQIKEEYPEECSEWDRDWKNFKPPNGESFVQMYERVKKFIKDLEKQEKENVLIVTHGGIIKTFYCYIMNENLDVYWKFSSKNTGITQLKYEYGNWYIENILNGGF